MFVMSMLVASDGCLQELCAESAEGGAGLIDRLLARFTLIIKTGDGHHVSQVQFITGRG